MTPYLEAMVAMSSPLGLIPEQVWDTAPIPAHDLYPGKPSGSAMPLVWAHAEFVKLCQSRVLGRPVDRPLATWARYRGIRPKLDYDIWSQNIGLQRIAAGKTLCLALKEAARIHWGVDGWQNIRDIETRDTGLGVHTADLPVGELAAGRDHSIHVLLARPAMCGRGWTTKSS